MRVNRRLFLTAMAALPAMAALKSAPAAGRIMPQAFAVGEVWGLRFTARAGMPAAYPSRRARSAMPAWHPEFC